MGLRNTFDCGTGTDTSGEMRCHHRLVLLIHGSILEDMESCRLRRNGTGSKLWIDADSYCRVRRIILHDCYR